MTQLVLGFEDTHGADSSIVNFIGVRGNYMREKDQKFSKITYEVRADWTDPDNVKMKELQKNAHMGY